MDAVGSGVSLFLRLCQFELAVDFDFLVVKINRENTISTKN